MSQKRGHGKEKRCGSETTMGRVEQRGWSRGVEQWVGGGRGGAERDGIKGWSKGVGGEGG